MSKILLAAAGAAGYVLGTRAGRERYEQISQQAQKLWTNPKVQETRQAATQAASTVTEKVTSSASSSGGDHAKTTTTPPSTPPTVTTTTPPTTPAATQPLV